MKSFDRDQNESILSNTRIKQTRISRNFFDLDSKTYEYFMQPSMNYSSLIYSDFHRVTGSKYLIQLPMKYILSSFFLVHAKFHRYRISIHISILDN